jgi:hypothetical protein
VQFAQLKQAKVEYKGPVVGECQCGIVFDNKVIVEIKSVKGLFSAEAADRPTIAF